MEINLYGKVLKFEPMDVEECTDSRGIKIKTFGKYITEGGRTYTLFSFDDLDNASYSTYKCYWHRQKDCQAYKLISTFSPKRFVLQNTKKQG